MSYIQYLVQKGLLSTQAEDIVQARRDPPDFGIGLKGVAASGGAQGSG